MDRMMEIGRFVWMGLREIWPYLLFSVPFAVILRLTGVGERLRGAFLARPVVSVVLATAAGAFSPLCSCSVIPVIGSLLIAGVPLGPVMSFWIASPTMDPEIFFLSASMLGWDLAVARLVATFVVSLGGGLLTLALERRGLFDDGIMRHEIAAGAAPRGLLSGLWAWIRARRRQEGRGEASAGCGCRTAAPKAETSARGCLTGAAEPEASTCGCDAQAATGRLGGFGRRLAREALSASVRVAEFMLLALLLEAVIYFYVPQGWIGGLIGRRNPFAPALAALIGIPLYTSELAALPLVGGLLEKGMDPGAALAFLIAGPVTTLPAMAAVWGLVRRRVFLLYLGIGLVGALLLGYAYSLVSRLV